MADQDKATPEVTWAQRSSATDESKNFVWLTIVVPDVPKSNLKLDLQSTGLTFEGHSDTLKRTYFLQLEFFAEIDTAASKINHTAQHVALKLQKKELKAEFWPRLLKDSKKVHFLKTDFDKWVDEDEQEENAEENFDFGGMGGMPGMPGGDFGGIDFSKLGGGGAPGEGGDSDDDDDMPELEEEEDDKKEGSKIEEIKDEPKITELKD
jgi:hypothetical protein